MVRGRALNALEETARGQVNTEPEANRVRISFDLGLYPLDAVYGAAYVFIDRCFVYLDAPEEGRVEVSLQGRTPLEKEALDELAGSFANELLSHAWRSQITEANRPILEAIVAQAMAGSGAAPGLEDMDEMDEMDFSEETFEDPLGIAMSWEEKYGDANAGKEQASQTDSPKESPES